ncbi:type II CAAX prenyl endopeptidase Rce1 family protein [Comamonas sp. GB3 AK4-5]|uniref:CPBP family glutamic-type intramembrane protease n=1 Tax=Comamonas sp. GB3 AK4-5 TaxID=3231487 RepID=UPI00351F745F
MLDPIDDDAHAMPAPSESRLLLQLSLLLWLLGLPGVWRMAWVVGQRLPGGMLPDWLLPAMGGLQSSLLLAAAVFFGAWVAPRVGLGAPLLTAWLTGQRLRPLLASLWLPGAGGGVLGAAWMVSLAQLVPDVLVPSDPLQTLPLWTQLLYGGISQELLLRWGMMSMLLFALWRLLQPQGGAPRPWLVAVAVLLSALLFALSSLPPAVALLGTLTPQILCFVLLGNTVFGLLVGYIYWRYGLEAAIVTHMLALAFSHGLT